MFDKFVDYMYYLLPGPLKKIPRKLNQFYIFLRAAGKLFDQTQQDIFRVREELIIISASEIMLTEHGRDRAMPRLPGENVEAYRQRLLLKPKIAAQAGTTSGIILALQAMGYEQSYCVPMYLQDPTRWAEFIVYLGSSLPSSINDLTVIDAEVMRVKPAYTLPSYGIEEGQTEVFAMQSSFATVLTGSPFCGTILCGTWPQQNLGTGS